MAVTTKDVVWLAGWLEGEGCFIFANGSPNITGTSTDFDTLEKANSILRGVIHKRQPPGKRKLVGHTRVGGGWAAGWMMTLYPLLGERRRAKIRSVLAKWRQTPGWTKATLGKFIPASCHPDRPSASLGLCELCYEKQRYANLPAEIKERNSRLTTTRTRERRRAHTPEEKQRLAEYRSAWRRGWLSRATVGELENQKLRGRENMRAYRQRKIQIEEGAPHVCA